MEAHQTLEVSGYSADVAVVTGDPAHAVVDLIEEHGCELVIIGTRAMGLLRKAWSGSVAQDLVNASPVPVLLVKPPEAQDAVAEGSE